MPAPRQISFADVSRIQGVPIFNYRPGMLARTSVALSAVRHGISHAIIASCGDSTDRGTTDSGGNTQFSLGGMGIQTAKLLAATAGYAVSYDNVFGNSVSGSLANSDNRVTIGGTVGQTENVPGGRFFVLSSSGAKFTFAPPNPMDTTNFYSIQNTGLGTGTIDLDGASPVTITGSGAKTVAKNTLTTTLGTHVANVTWASGTFDPIGIECYNDSIKHVRFWNMGWPSSTSTQWALNANIWNPRLLLASTVLRPHTVFLNLGLNDMNTAPVDPTIYAANMLALVNALKVNSDVILETWVPPSPSSWASQSIQDAHRAALFQVATQADVPLIDMTSLYVDYATALSLGLMSGPVHQFRQGYGLKAAARAALLRNL